MEGELELPGQHELFLRRESHVVLLERLEVAHGDKVRFGVAVTAGDSVEEPFLQFLAEEVRRVAFGVVGIANSPGACDHKVGLAPVAVQHVMLGASGTVLFLQKGAKMPKFRQISRFAAIFIEKSIIFNRFYVEISIILGYIYVEKSIIFG